MRTVSKEKRDDPCRVPAGEHFSEVLGHVQPPDLIVATGGPNLSRRVTYRAPDGDGERLLGEHELPVSSIPLAPQPPGLGACHHAKGLQKRLRVGWGRAGEPDRRWAAHKLNVRHRL